MYSRETELRHLRPNDVYQLGVILDDNNCWKKLMEIIPKELNNQVSSIDGGLNWEQSIAAAGLKYNNDHIRLIESAVARPGESRLTSQILLEEWGTSGRRHERPTVGVLLQLLVQAELFRAADFVAETFLNESAPPRPLSGPAARIELTLHTDLYNDVEEFANDSSYYPGTVTLNENANYANSVSDNNKDYYVKYQQLEKHVESIAAEVTNTNTDTSNSNSNKLNDNVVPKPPPRTRSARQLLLQQQKQTASEASTAEAYVLTQHSQLQQQHQQQRDQIHLPYQQRSFTESLQNASQNLPNFSILMKRDSVQNATTLNDATANLEAERTTESAILSEAPIPMISILAATSNSSNSTTTTKSTEITESTNSVCAYANYSSDSTAMSLSENEVLPVISALNLNGERDDSLTADVSTAISSSHSERQDAQSESGSSLSDESNDEERLPQMFHTHTDHNVAVGPCAITCEESDDIDVEEADYDDNSVPNLSIFEQRSSNNDSSLTTVTGTSGENSFELSVNDCSSASNEDNIPCLSALKQ